jgi:hypothetical protein
MPHTTYVPFLFSHLVVGPTCHSFPLLSLTTHQGPLVSSTFPSQRDRPCLLYSSRSSFAASLAPLARNRRRHLASARRTASSPHSGGGCRFVSLPTRDVSPFSIAPFQNLQLLAAINGGWRRPFLPGEIKRLQSASTTLNTANPLPLLRLYKLPASLSLLVPVARSIVLSSARLCPTRMCDAAAAHYSLIDDCAEYLTKTLRPCALLVSVLRVGLTGDVPEPRPSLADPAVPSLRHRTLELVRRRPLTQGWRQPTDLFSKSCFESCDLSL